MSELWMQQSVVYCGASCCMHITCGCGSVLLCRCSDTFAFMGDVIFAHKPTLLDFAPAEAQCTRSLELDYKLRAVIPVAGRRTHGTTSRALTVTFRVATRSMTGLFRCVLACLSCVQMHRRLLLCALVLCVTSVDVRAELLLRRRRTY